MTAQTAAARCEDCQHCKLDRASDPIDDEALCLAGRRGPLRMNHPSGRKNREVERARACVDFGERHRLAGKVCRG